MSAVDDAVQNRVGKSGFSDDFVPCFDRNLAGDERGFLGAVVDEFEQVPALRPGQGWLESVLYSTLYAIPGS